MANSLVESLNARPHLISYLRGFGVPSGAIGPTVAFLDVFSLLITMEMVRRVHAGDSADAMAYLGFGVVASLTFLLCGRHFRLHQYSRLLTPLSSAPYIVFSVVLGAAAVVILLFLLKVGGSYSRAVLVLFALIASLAILFERLIVAILLKRAISADVIRGKRVVLIGDVGELECLTRKDLFFLGLDEVARVGLQLSKDRDELSDGERSSIQQAIGFARGSKATEYALVIPWSYELVIEQVTEMLKSSPRSIRLYPDRKTRAILSRKQNENLDSCICAEIHPEPLSFSDRLAKRSFDIAVALFALTVLSPILLVVALLIKLDSPGPVFFRQTRKGYDDQKFRIWKFRTMSVMEDGPQVTQAARNDHRVTRVGKILRRTSVDEMPQLFNVLRGEMSIVGPRPHAVAHDDHYGDIIAEYALRRHVKPGLTGLAQVQGLRGETKSPKQMAMRVEKDLWYINNWSLWLDARIAFQTLVVLAINEAY